MVAATLARLRDEGLTRHEAIHAIASVLVTHLHNLLTPGRTQEAFERRPT